MAANPERILVVENDPDISDVIARQALQPLGFQVSMASDASSAIGLAARIPHDLVIANLSLPGLSGKDLLVALSSQGLSVPFIVIAQKGDEQNIIQAFRLGAADFLMWPARDAEIVAVVERVIKQIRERRARQELDKQLTQTNQELQRRVRDLTTIFTIGRAVLSTSDERALFDKIVEAAVTISEADVGWMTVRDEKNRAFLLVSHRNLPENWAKKLNQPLDDGVGGLVSMSGETLAISGEPLKQFKVAALGKSVVVVPIKVQKEVIGLLITLRKSETPFERGEQTLLEAIADYASIYMVNAQLFRALALTARKP